MEARHLQACNPDPGICLTVPGRLADRVATGRTLAERRLSAVDRGLRDIGGSRQENDVESSILR